MGIPLSFPYAPEPHPRTGHWATGLSLSIGEAEESSLTTLAAELHRCAGFQTILFPQGPPCFLMLRPSPTPPQSAAPLTWVWRHRNTVLYRILILGPRIHTYGKTKTGCFHEVHSAKKFWPVMVEKAQKL